MVLWYVRKTKECSRTVAVWLVVVCSVVCWAVLLCWKGGGVAQAQGGVQGAGCRAWRRAQGLARGMTKECSRTVAVWLVVVCSVVCWAVLLCWKGGGVAQAQGVA